MPRVSARTLSGVSARPPTCLSLGPEDFSGPAPCKDGVLADDTDECRQADRIELRLDLFPRPREALTLIGKLPRPVLATLRPRAEGGGFDGPASERVALLEAAAAAGADWLDVECDILPALSARAGVPLLVSRHLPATSSQDWRAAWRELAALGRPFKLAAYVHDLAPALELAERGWAGEGLAVPLGPMGRAARVLAAGPRTPWFYVHGRGSPERGVGQWSLAAWRELVWPAPLFGLLGYPIEHSLSPRLHGSITAHAGLAACYLALPCHDFASALSALRRRPEFRGASVTAPHKRAAHAACTRRSPEARAAEAVNTITVGADGELEGDNTDVLAYAELAAEAGVSTGARALVLGRGGAAAAARVALEARGCEVVLAGRESPGLLAWARACDVLVQATPLADACPLPPEAFRPGQIAIESVYAPRLTAFLERARAAGARVWDGLDLFLRQAVHQTRRWHGVEIDAQAARVLLDSGAGNEGGTGDGR